MVGGGEGSFIGAIHRMAAALDGEIELVAGCFSSDPERGRRAGAQLGLAASRTYPHYETMLETEAGLAADQRMQFVAIVTPNHLHFPIAEAALRRGFHVLCDKPAALNLEETLALKQQVDSAGGLFGLTHTYAAYPLVRQARAMVTAGELGGVRRVTVSYPQGWLADAGDTCASPQAQWRTDPQKSGESGCFGDIGTHAHHLAEHITGVDITELCADLTTYVDGRVLDDDGAVLFRMANGARGTLTASQICAGEGNDLQISVYCDLGSLAWRQETPNALVLKRRGQPAQVLKAGVNCDYLHRDARAYCRTPAGHPEGYIEAFANIYRDFARAIKHGSTAIYPSFASIDEGVRGMLFVRAVLESSRNHSTWVRLGDLVT
ncbi:Gfo/Idh/MocA family oxidoreductase [Exilibacterium tricleocarpae]|uniref:Gfo/Idh/MocA family oxidoreductase n=2 Tax=Exilibacterium tricleocarpae TaxID=2591008 RepID=A0A545SPE6_9GAMM|nr:Gfo/Idh/MocA family oxidoreductase [Exilibacterium tricleocarpae]